MGLVSLGEGRQNMLPPRKPFELPASVTIRFYPEPDGQITAHALDFDLVSTAKDRAEALRKIRLSLRSYIEFGFLNGWAEDIRYPAPAKFWPPEGTNFETLEPITIMHRSLLVYSESPIAHVDSEAHPVAQKT
jgi:hypothetical protein